MAVVTQIQVRRGTATQWTSANPTLASGEWGFESDTNKLKIGNGSSTWTALSYAVTGSTGTVTSITAGTGLSGGTITSNGTIAIDSTVATLTGSQTLTNKTLTTPVIATISNTGTLTLPTSTDTLVGKATTDTFTNKTFDTAGTGNSFSINGTAITANTGTGNNVLATSPTITTPKITLTYSTKTTAYTFASGDEGNIFSMNASTAQQFNIPTDATFNFAIGTQFNVFWITGAGQPTIGAVTPGTTTVISTGATSATPKLRAANSMATALKIAANSWIVTGDIA